MPSPRPIALALLIVCAIAHAQEDADAPRQDRRESSRNTLGPLHEITRQIKKFGPWDQQIEIIEPAIDRLWEQNGWTDDADLFARDTSKDVARIPPWRVMERLTRLTDLVGQRYHLSDQQKMSLQGSILSETTSLLIEHGPTLMEQVRKAVDRSAEYRDRGPTREELAAFMAEWTRATEGLHQDALKATERIRAGLEAGMDPSQRELLNRDLPTLEKLTRFANDQREAWARGQWKPSDWGLRDEDLAWRRGAVSDTSGAEAPVQSGEAQPPPSRWLAYEPATWIAYVRHNTTLYRLDEPQQAALMSIHTELFERATAYISQRGETLSAVTGAARATDDAWAPVRACFGELTERMAAIPTQAQRDAAGERK